MGKPAALPVEPVNRGTVRRKPVVRFHARMVLGKLYPLLVQLRDEGGKNTVAINGDGTHGGAVTVQPIIPGALVSPTAMDISTATGSEARFWVTPLALGKLRDARVELRTGHRILESVPLTRGPDWLVSILGAVLTAIIVALALFAANVEPMTYAIALGATVPIVPVLYFLSYSRYIKVRRGWIPWILLFFTITLPILLYTAKQQQWQPAVLMLDDRPKPAAGVRSNQDEPAAKPDAADPAKAPPKQPDNEPKPETPKPEKKPVEPMKDPEKPKDNDTPKPDEPKKDEPKKEEPKKDADKPKTTDEKKPDPDKPPTGAAGSDDDSDLLAASQDEEPKTPPAPSKTPASKVPSGGGRGAPGGQRPPGGAAGGGPGGIASSTSLPAPPNGEGNFQPPPMVPYYGSMAIEKWLDKQVKDRPSASFNEYVSNYDTRDLAIIGLAKCKPAILSGYWVYDFLRSLQHSELLLFGVLFVLTAAYCSIFGPARALRVGKPVELPAM
jgi:outer membrane biosynthesis protein TonB